MYRSIQNFSFRTRRSSLFWDVTQRRLAVTDVSGQSYSSVWPL